MSRSFVVGLVRSCVIASLLAGCMDKGAVDQAGITGGSTAVHDRGADIPDGTRVEVRLTSSLSTRDSHKGDEWEGVLLRPVTANGGVVVDEGAVVHGQVRLAEPPEGRRPATLELAVTSFEQDGREDRVTATAAPIAAGHVLTSSDIELRPGTVLTFVVNAQVARL